MNTRNTTDFNNILMSNFNDWLTNPFSFTLIIAMIIAFASYVFFSDRTTKTSNIKVLSYLLGTAGLFLITIALFHQEYKKLDIGDIASLATAFLTACLVSIAYKWKEQVKFNDNIYHLKEMLHIVIELQAEIESRIKRTEILLRNTYSGSLSIIDSNGFKPPFFELNVNDIHKEEKKYIKHYSSTTCDSHLSKSTKRAITEIKELSKLIHDTNLTIKNFIYPIQKEFISNNKQFTTELTGIGGVEITSFTEDAGIKILDQLKTLDDLDNRQLPPGNTSLATIREQYCNIPTDLEKAAKDIKRAIREI